jgi:hypothetical protein
VDGTARTSIAARRRATGRVCRGRATARAHPFVSACALAAGALLLLTACGDGPTPEQPAAPPAETLGPSVETTASTSPPTNRAPSVVWIDRVVVDARGATVVGNASDACTEVDAITSRTLPDGAVELTAFASRPADAVCAQVLTPFAWPMPPGTQVEGRVTAGGKPVPVEHLADGGR